MTGQPDIVEAVLGRLEGLEQPALSWGITDSVLAREVVVRTIDETLSLLDDHITQSGEVLAELETRALIVPVDGLNYRTRIAEAVRLFASLRQLFPHHLQRGMWAAAPHLVSDYRFITQERRFPRRDIPAQTAITDIEARSPVLTARQSEVLAALLADAGQGLARFQIDATVRVLASTRVGSPSATFVAAPTGSG